MAQPMFVLVQFNVKDFPKYFEHYGSLMSAEVAKFGGQFLAASRDVVVKEGDPVAMFSKRGSNAAADAVGGAGDKHAAGHTPAW